MWLCGLRLDVLCLRRSHLRCALWSWCTGEICIHLVILAGGTDDYLTPVFQRMVKRKRFGLFFLFCFFLFASLSGVTVSVVYGDDARVRFWMCCFRASSMTGKAGKYTDWLFLQHNIISASIPAQDGWLNKAPNKPGVDWCIQAMHYCLHRWLSSMA